MLFQNLCPPAMIYLVFSIVQIVIDIGKGLYNTALAKMIVAAVFATLLNYLCNIGLGIFSWIIVFVPFLFMSVIISILLYVLGLKPTSGKLRVYRQESKEDDPLKTRGDKNHKQNEHIDKARKGKRDLVYEQKQEIVSMKKRINELEKEKHSSSGGIPLDNYSDDLTMYPNTDKMTMDMIRHDPRTKRSLQKLQETRNRRRNIGNVNFYPSYGEKSEVYDEINNQMDNDAQFDSNMTNNEIDTKIDTMIEDLKGKYN